MTDSVRSQNGIEQKYYQDDVNTIFCIMSCVNLAPLSRSSSETPAGGKEAVPVNEQSESCTNIIVAVLNRNEIGSDMKLLLVPDEGSFYLPCGEINEQESVDSASLRILKSVSPSLVVEGFEVSHQASSASLSESTTGSFSREFSITSMQLGALLCALYCVI